MSLYSISESFIENIIVTVEDSAGTPIEDAVIQIFTDPGDVLQDTGLSLAPNGQRAFLIGAIGTYKAIVTAVIEGETIQTTVQFEIFNLVDKYGILAVIEVKSSRYKPVHNAIINSFQRKDLAIPSIVDDGGFIRIDGHITTKSAQIYSTPAGISFTDSVDDQTITFLQIIPDIATAELINFISDFDASEITLEIDRVDYIGLSTVVFLKSGLTETDITDPDSTTLDQFKFHNKNHEVGDTIYFGSDSTYDSAGSITDIDYTDDEVTLDIAFNAADADMFINFITQYGDFRTVIKILDYDTDEVLATGNFRPATDGSTEANLSGLIKNELNFNNDFLYSSTNQKDTNLSKKVYTKTQEIWDGGQNSEVDNKTEFFFVTNSAKQIQDEIGNDMADFVVFDGGDIIDTKFLTLFEEITMWEGRRFDIQFIYDWEFVDDLERVERRLDSGGNELSIDTTTLASTEKELLNRMMLTDVQFASDVKSLEVFLKTPALSEVTERKTIKINRDCFDNPYYVLWLNSLGGWSYWLFRETQQVERRAQVIDSYQVPVTALKSADRVNDYTGKRSQEKLTIGDAGLSDSEIVALEEILDSPRVYHLKEDGNQEVILVEEGTFQVYETGDNSHSIEFSVLPPEKFTQRF